MPSVEAKRLRRLKSLLQKIDERLFGAELGPQLVRDLGEAVTHELEADLALAAEYLEKEITHQETVSRLQDNEARMHLFIEYAPTSLAVFDTDLRYLAASRRWLSDFGLTDTDIIGKSHYQIFPEIPPRWKEIHQRCLAGEVQRCDRDPFERAGGRMSWQRWEVRPWYTIRDGVSQVGGIVIFTEDITDSVNAEQALRDSEAKYRLLSENGSDVVWLYDLRANRFTYVSPSVSRLRGYSVEEVLGQSMEDALAPESFARVAKTLPGRLASFASGDDSVRSQSHEVEQSCKDGSVVSTEVVTTLIADSQRRVTHIQGVTRDISERKQAQRALSESRAKLDAALASMTDAVFISDREGRFIDFNDAFATFHKFSNKSECATTFADYPALLEVCLPDGTVANVEQWAVPRALRGEVASNAEYRLRRKDTGETWFGSYSFAPIRDAQNDVVGAVVVARDITKQKVAERELIDHANRLAAILEAAPVPMMLVDGDKRVRFLNSAFTKVFGYTSNDLPTLEQWRVLAFPDPAVRERIVTAWRAELVRAHSKRGLFVPLEMQVRCRDGSTRTVLASGAQLPHSASATGLATLYDITELRRAEQARAGLESQLQHAQKMESVGRLAGGVAHDFNNMLGAILGHLEFVMEEIGEQSRLRADLIEIRKAAERSADLTKQLLAFARKQTVSPQTLDLNQTVAGTLKMLQRLIGEDIQLEWHPSPSLWAVRADPVQIDQVLTNLCINARDAIEDVGRITIESTNAICDADYCETHAGVQPGDYVVLVVSDDGCGMDKATQARLFEPFFTTKEVGKGTGLGLATVYGIVKQNDGFINVYSEPGHGTTFRIYLPRHSPVTSLGTSDEQPAPASGSETILVVEDEPAMLSLSTRILERLGYEIVGAMSPSKALALASEHHGTIDLLVTDVVMPEMNGRELASKLLLKYPKLRCLYMSGYTANVIAHHGVLDDGVHFIQKPFARGDLAAAVRRALD
jgi:PAS domain S-box-containing protein